MNATAQALRGVLYCRKSSDDAGESISQQQAWAKEAALRDRIVIVKEFADQSVSGWDTARRSGFAAMLAFCQEQAAEAARQG
jgi:DNA invertase Pin-like site-specific DNA recombinase